jgi:hypothetical protein
MMTALMLVAASTVFVTSGARFVKLEQHDERGFTAAHPATWERNWTPSGDRGWVSPSFKASIVSKTAQYEHALSISEGVSAFTGQIEVWGDDVIELSSRQVAWGPFSGMEVEYQFSIRGVEQVIRAVIVPRGRYLHMVYLQTESALIARYSDLSRRLLDRVNIAPPPGLSRARAEAAAPNSSPMDDLALGVEAGRAGYYLESGQAYTTAFGAGDNPTRVEAALGLMALYIDYGAGVTVEQVRELSELFPLVSSIQLAAAEVMTIAGNHEESAQILSDSWDRGVQDYSIGEAIRARGISVDSSGN